MNKEDYEKYYIQSSDHYLIPKDIFDELFEEMVNWREESKELKKQLDEYKRLGFKHLNDKCIKLENQQKEFIEYLEKEKDIYPYDISDYTYENIIDTILSKYYEIIEK